MTDLIYESSVCLCLLLHPDLVVSLALPVQFLPAQVFPLIVELLASGKTDLNFTPPALQVDLERNQCIALDLNGAGEFGNFRFVKQELPLAQRIAVEDIALLIRADIHSLDKGLSVVHAHIGFLDADLSLPDRLDLRAVKDNSALIFFFDKIIVVGLFIICD